MGDLRPSLSDVFTAGSSKRDKISPTATIGGGGGGGYDVSDEISYVAADTLEQEIELLMASGYNRETAVKILLERKRAQQDRGGYVSCQYSAFVIDSF